MKKLYRSQEDKKIAGICGGRGQDMAIQIQLDNRIRLVASVLLLAKFVDENSGWQSHLLKRHTLEYLKAYEGYPCAVVSRELAEFQWMPAFYYYFEDHLSVLKMRREIIPRHDR